MNLNRTQIILIVIAVLSILGAGSATAQLTEIFGSMIATKIVAGCSLLTAIMSGGLAAITGQGALVQQVQDMPGVDKVILNKNANATLATLAVSDANPKIEAAPEAQIAVEATAKAAAAA